VLAAQVAGGVCATEPRDDIISAYLDAGGDPDHTWGQVVLAWAPEQDRGLREAHAQFRFAAGGWKVQSELPNPVNFDAATQTLEPADLADLIPAGPDPDAHAEAVRSYLDAGYRRIAVAYPGSEPDEFMQFWTDQVRPRV
jgi:hypothetical protein